MIVIDTPQGTDEWLELRFRAITGTKLAGAIGASYTKAKGWTLGKKSTIETAILHMVDELQSEQELDDFSSAATERGHELEPISIAATSEKLGIDFKKVGMLQSETIKGFRFSPDGICIDGGVIVGGIETKSEAGKLHIEYIINDEVPPKHLIQCLCAMIMSDDVRWWVFSSYNDLNHVNPLFTKTIYAVDYADFIKEARDLLVEFFSEVEVKVKELGGVYNG